MATTNTRKFLFRWRERARRVAHFRVARTVRKIFSKAPNKDNSEYYKGYDVIYSLADTPEFVNVYKMRDLIQEDFGRLADGGFIPKSGSLLDLGCGEGSNAIYFQSQGYAVSGFDISENAIRQAKKHAIEKSSSVVFDVIDVIYMGNDEKTYDICTDVGCLHMLVFGHHRCKYLEAVHRRMNAGSVFYLFQDASENDVKIKDEEEYVATSVSFQHRRMLDSGDVVEHPGCGGMPMSLAQYREELEHAGFEVKHAESVRTPLSLFASLVVVKREVSVTQPL